MTPKIPVKNEYQILESKYIQNDFATIVANEYKENKN